MPNPDAPPPDIGAVLDARYELLRHIAAGGMGDVYEAEDRALHRRVAVKLYRSASPPDRARFDAEVHLLARLDHPGLVRVFDAGSQGDDAYVVLELVDGPPLSDVLHRRSALLPADVAALGADIADALAHIHDHGVVHRDVTPANILVDATGRPRLVDFGIARLLGSPRVTAASMTMGTAAYMAPEQVEGREVTPAADVYALGLVLLEALTGRREFDGTLHEVAAARLARDPDTAGGVPPAWRPMLEDMTRRNPGSRPSARVVHRRLMEVVRGTIAVTAPLAAVTMPVTTTPAYAATQAIPVAGGTAEMPVLPMAVIDERRPRRPFPGLPLAIAAAAIALVLLVALAARGGGGSEDEQVPVDLSGVSTTVTTAPPTTAPIVVEPDPVERPADAEPTSGTDQGKGKDPKGKR
ncbi:MAG: serine/threonine-protein kinase [Acidimicrobiales bacterium]|nr:serine/threonine-protein kinase [Acidimicrobiales bacterium]